MKYRIIEIDGVASKMQRELEVAAKSGWIVTFFSVTLMPTTNTVKYTAVLESQE